MLFLPPRATAGAEDLPEIFHPLLWSAFNISDLSPNDYTTSFIHGLAVEIGALTACPVVISDFVQVFQPSLGSPTADRGLVCGRGCWTRRTVKEYWGARDQVG